MSLTDDWKTGKYNSGFYYYEDTNGKVCIARWHELNPAVCVEILDKVPDYGYISELESKNKHLLGLQANQDKEVEKLRELLWECLSHLTSDGISVTPLNILLDKINEALGNDK